MRALVALCVAVGLLNPACKGKKNTVLAPTGTVLLDEQFASFPNSEWTVSGTGDVTFIAFAGNPAPSIQTAPGKSSEASLEIQSTTQFSGPDLTFSADMILEEVGPGLGGGSFVIRTFPAGSVVASAMLDAQSSALTFTIGSSTSAPLVIIPGWHTYTFAYGGTGDASWRLDGKVFFSMSRFLPPSSTIVSLENDSVSVFDFDNVLVTAP